MPKLNKSQYDADGVEFTILTYETIKSTKSGPKKYWLFQDYSTGRRRLLNNRTLRAAEQRARKIRASTQSQAQRCRLLRQFVEIGMPQPKTPNDATDDDQELVTLAPCWDFVISRNNHARAWAE